MKDARVQLKYWLLLNVTEKLHGLLRKGYAGAAPCLCRGGARDFQGLKTQRCCWGAAAGQGCWKTRPPSSQMSTGKLPQAAFLGRNNPSNRKRFLKELGRVSCFVLTAARCSHLLRRGEGREEHDDAIPTLGTENAQGSEPGVRVCGGHWGWKLDMLKQNGFSTWSIPAAGF